MKSRAVVSLALAAALGCGLTACNYISPQRTTEWYAASDGVNLEAGGLSLRNLMIVVPTETASPAGGSTGQLVGAVVNPGKEQGTLKITGEGISPITIQIPAGQDLVQLSFGEGESVPVQGSKLTPGTMLELTFTPSTGSSASIEVPVLDGTLKEYSTIAPTGAASPTSLPSTTAGATPGATEQATETPQP
ncbi:hypothetical protein USB125703_00300 [Pseudoclavibacter triregionum]|nr:hypothetical protein USB125703_00300 [Pseudoclavibacter triregionum]